MEDFHMRLTLICLSLLLLSFNISAEDSRKSLEKTIHDYISLYSKDTLDQWKTLFHPSVIVAFPADDGGITIRNLDEFLERQRNYFAKRKSISERLENVQILEGKRIARVTADFIFIDEGVEKPGKLGLHLVESNDGWKIVAVIFSYN
jgi:hypothetical protein